MQGSSMHGANSVLASKMDNSFVVLPKQRPQAAQGVPPRPHGGAGNGSQTGKPMDESFVVVYKSDSPVDGGGAQSPSLDKGPNGPLQANNSGFHSTITLLKRAFEIATTQTQVEQPLCLECMKVLNDKLDKEVEDVNRDITAYESCFKLLEGETREVFSEADFLREKLKVEDEERKLEAAIAEMEKQNAEVHAELKELDLKSGRFKELEERWAAIALTTVLIRVATIPLLIGQLRATARLNLLRPRLEQLKLEMQNMEPDPEALRAGQKRIMALFTKYGVTPFTQLKGLFIQDKKHGWKVPSFQTGGTLWFIDLSTPDSLVILPILTAMTFWITVECNLQEGLEGIPIAKTMKTYSRILTVISVPVMMSFPKALFCYWLTSNVFSLSYGLAIRNPKVKRIMNLPEFSAPPPTATEPPFSMFEAVKQDTTIEAEPSSHTEASRVSSRSISSSSSSILKQRLRSLEKHVKVKKKQN